jgi:hypothetical protein
MRRYRKLPRDVQHLLSRDPLDKIGAPRGNDMPHVRVGDLYGQSLPDPPWSRGQSFKRRTTILHSEGGDCKRFF